MNPRTWGCKVDIVSSGQHTKVCLVAYSVHVTNNCALVFQGLGNKNRLQGTPPKINLEKGICAGWGNPLGMSHHKDCMSFLLFDSWATWIWGYIFPFFIHWSMCISAYVILNKNELLEGKLGHIWIPGTMMVGNIFFYSFLHQIFYRISQKSVKSDIK